MSVRRIQHCHSLSVDSEEANGNHVEPGPEPEPEELDWDSFSTTLEHRLAAVGKFGWFVHKICVDYCGVYIYLDILTCNRCTCSRGVAN